MLLLEGALASKQETGPGSWTWMERDNHIHLMPLWTKNHMVGRESFGRRAGRWGGMRALVTDKEGAAEPALCTGQVSGDNSPRSGGHATSREFHSE